MQRNTRIGNADLWGFNDFGNRCPFDPADYDLFKQLTKLS